MILTPAKSANAQMWIASAFQSAPTGPNGQQNVTAICSTSAIDPNTGLSVAADYQAVWASCGLTPSNGPTIYSPQCPYGQQGDALFDPQNSAAFATPAATCSILFQPQPGVAYTLTSVHGIQFNIDPPGTQCGQYANAGCFSDPLGYYTYPWPKTWPVYTMQAPLYLPQSAPCGATGNCASQDIPSEALAPQSVPSDIQFISAPEVWPLGYSSAVYSLCPAPTIASILPATWVAGTTYSPVTIAGTGFVAPANATASCPASTLSISTPSGAVIAIASPTVVSSTQITAIVTPPAKEPTETATVAVSGNPAATFNVQILACPNPTITSITPDKWLAGETYPAVGISPKVTIVGTNFTTAAEAASTGCPVTTVAVTAATGSVTVSGVIVVDKTKITVAVAPDENDPTEPATVTVGAGSNTATATAQIKGLPPAKTEWKGNMVSGTTQQAVVGQKIELKGKPKDPLPAGYTLTKSTWKVEGTTIGSLTMPAGQNGFHTEPAPLDKPDITFYWLSQDDSYEVDYSYCATVPSGKEICPSTTEATATFNVSGPISPNVLTCAGVMTPDGCSAEGPMAQVSIIPGPKVGLGDLSARIKGIEFTASDDPSSSPGKFSFLQTLQSLNMTYEYSNGAPCVADGSGLDNRYPYPMSSDISTNDSPNAPLFGDDTEVTKSMQATMYLLWTSSTAPDVIPVTEGYVSWSWFGDAVQDPKTRAWSINPKTTSFGTAQTFEESYDYPEWATVYLNQTGADPTQPNYSPCIH